MPCRTGISRDPAARRYKSGRSGTLAPWAGLALFVMLTASSLPAWAGPGEVLVRGGYTLQRVPFDHGYGAFLKRRFGAENVDLEGIVLSVVIMGSGELGYGVEFDWLKGGFDYVTLNGQPGSAEFSLQQYLLKAHLRPPGNWEYALGLGGSVLIRSLESFRSAEITAANFQQNQGVAGARTLGPVILGEGLYQVRPFGQPLELGLRLAYAPHLIDQEDPRPALDEAQRPVSSRFNVGGFAWLVMLTLVF